MTISSYPVYCNNIKYLTMIGSRILKLVFILLFFVSTNSTIINAENNYFNNNIKILGLFQVNSNTSKNVLFSSQDLEKKNKLSLDEVMNKHDISEYSTGGVDVNFIDLNLSNKKLIIEILYGDENTMYYLLNVDSDLDVDEQNSLDVTPNWSEPCDDGDQCKKEFEIFEDYLIHIKTVEISQGDTIKYDNYYRLNDKGEFYEVKN